MRYASLALALFLFAQPALAQYEGRPRVEGVVTSVDPGSNTFTVSQGGPNYTLWVQRSTRFRGHGDRLRDLHPGDRVEAEGVQLDDGRLLALEVEIREHHHEDWDRDHHGYPGGKGNYEQPAAPIANTLRLTSLSNGMVVAPSFMVSGQTLPNTLVWINMRCTRPVIPGVLTAQSGTYQFQGRSDASGFFNVPVSAAQEPPGTRLDMEVQARDSRNVPLATNAVQVVRQ